MSGFDDHLEPAFQWIHIESEACDACPNHLRSPVLNWLGHGAGAGALKAEKLGDRGWIRAATRHDLDYRTSASCRAEVT